MVEVEEISAGISSTWQQQFRWLLSIFYRPWKTMSQVTSQERPVWLLPLLVLSLLTLASVWASGPLRLAAAANAGAEPPENFEYMTPEQQEQYMQAQASMNGPAMLYTFPAITSLAGVWLSWFLLGGVLHLVLTLFGSRSTNTATFNLTAWASMPVAIRLIVQTTAMLTTHQLIISPGLSGFVGEDAQGAISFIRVLLSMVDLYLIWQFFLLWIGAASSAGITRSRAFSGVLISVLLLLALSSLPGFLSTQLSGLNVVRPFLF